MILSVYFAFLASVICFIQAKKVLVLPHLQGSHVNILSTIGEELVNRDHEVYCVLSKHSSIISKTQKKGIKVLAFDVDESVMLMDSDSYNDFMNKAIFDETIDVMEIVFNGSIVGVLESHCDHMLHDKELMETIKRIKFDMAVVDPVLMNLCLLALPYHLGIPYVGVSISLQHWHMGIPALPSFVDSTFDQHGLPKTLWEKIQTTLTLLYLSSPWIFFHSNRTLLYEFAPGKSSWIDLLKEAKLFISERDYILDRPKPSMPQLISTAGMTYGPAKPLPSEITSRMSEKGNFVVSFGSTAGAMPLKYVQAFANTFAEFKDYTVFWKLPNVDPAMLPPNVVAMTWLPQNDLLAHPSTKLLIAHCGTNGIHEALYHGVPIIGFPLLGEQSHNAFLLEQRGYGLHCNIKNFTSDELAQAIEHVINSNTINDKVKMISQILHDRKLPREEAADWIEHVMKYGSEHLRSSAIDLPLYELFCLDILAVVLVAFILIMIGLLMVCKCVYKYCFSSSGVKKMKRQ